MAGIAEQLQKARRAAGMTQDELAAKVHVTRATISSWERGHTIPRMEAIRRISSALNYDFVADAPFPAEEAAVEAPASTDSAADAPAPAEPATEPPATADVTPPAPSVAEPSPPAPEGSAAGEPPAQRRPWPWIAAGVFALALCLALLLWPGQRLPALLRGGETAPDVDPALLLLKEPALFTREWFQGENARYDGEPYVQLTGKATLNTVDQPFPLWEYSLTADEVSGQRFTLDRIDIFTFQTRVGYSKTWIKGDAIWCASSGNAWKTEGCNPADSIEGVGYIVYGHDEWARSMSFRTFIDLSVRPAGQP